MNTQKCRICSSDNCHVIYDGPIRSGGVGSEFVDGYTYRRCEACTFVFIDPVPKDLDDYYESERYRLQFHYGKEVEEMQALYDQEQNVRVSRIGIENMRNKTVVDFGAGAGLFLDSIKGVAKKTVAVEPSGAYQEHLKARGHLSYRYADELREASVIAEVATSFDVIEHIYDVNQFVKGIYETLADGGAFYVSMPQENDIVRLLCPDQYESFFYQTAHLNYFNAKTIEIVLMKARFQEIKIAYLHKYDMRNVVQWAQHGKPGESDAPMLDEHFHAIYRQEIERLEIASHLFVIAIK